MKYHCEGAGLSDEVREETRKIVVPKTGDLRTVIVYLHHYGEWGCHTARDQMVINIKRCGFWWRNMKNSCEQAVARCVMCIASKRAQQARQGLFSLRQWYLPFQCITQRVYGDLFRVRDVTRAERYYRSSPSSWGKLLQELAQAAGG